MSAVPLLIRVSGRDRPRVIHGLLTLLADAGVTGGPSDLDLAGTVSIT